MNLPNPKDIKKLANMCRKAGIKHFKCDGMEFTLDDEPVKPTKQSSKAPSAETNAEFETDTLTNEQLLMWSVHTDQTESGSS